MILCLITIIILLIIILILSLALYVFSKKTIFLSKKEKEFILFTIDIYEQYSDSLGIQSKEQHELLCSELDKIKNKILDENKDYEKDKNKT